VAFINPIALRPVGNNVEDYSRVAILFAIPKRFEFMVFDDLKNLISVNQHGF
jgi:hypothetical protein